MDYEKAYKEMVQRARELHEGGNALTKQQMEIVCPELAESEDKRVNEEIRNFLIDMECKREWIAYLEKQKINTEGDFARGYDCGYECCLNSHGAEWFEKQKEQKLVTFEEPCNSDEYEVVEIGNATCLRRKEQKPAEQIEESEEKSIGITLIDALKGNAQLEWELKRAGVDVKRLVTYLEQKEQTPKEDKDAIEPTPKQDYSGLTDFERAIHRGFLCAGVENVPVKIIKETAQECIDSMPKDGIAHRLLMKGEITPSEYIRLAYPNKKELQKPAEWSEEDELMRNACITFIKDEKFKGYERSYECIDWLKSLCPQYHWKPSKEQMRALEHFISSWGESGTMSPQNPILCAAKSLYNDLKKL